MTEEIKEDITIDGKNKKKSCKLIYHKQEQQQKYKQS